MQARNVGNTVIARKAVFAGIQVNACNTRNARNARITGVAL